jgi:glycyl-tRNA synthetase beta chain
MPYRLDEIRAVRAGALKDLPRTVQRLAAVHAVRAEAGFDDLAAAFKRAANLLKQARAGAGGEVDRALLREDAELAFFDALLGVEGRVQEQFSGGGFVEGLRSLVSIKPHLDLFFEKVMVMAEEPELRRQRLGLLSRLVRLFNAAADLSELQAGAPVAAAQAVKQ